ncbi:putative acyl-CoA synthetase [Actinoplanes missouriensis 431]|uniref:Putative acyl-CoA synthetase n=1 Tax=Actinoplanes missouriensis (strain ATCC 14538 / DSM 43046 / CBS 188.64 / JCM 3121 / NBRC 102363 / NCIMB 12654 / NRRL B-3342 / UNCC 431) TaxID=512565 RepID=I0HD81_ACTM4|nr:AMP-binding protein [Actinoplanes missouriensis]BAL90968.1 putative acyl-CoA synthetase [Actinoplanes missouriensis 431]
MLRPGGADLTIAGGVREFGRATPDAIAVRDGDRALSYAALDSRSSRLACALLGLGLATGDRVALLCGNRLEYPEIAAGIAKAGLVLVPVNPRLTAPEVAFILGHSGARVLIVDEAHGGSVPDFSGHVVWIGAGYEQWIDAARAADPWVAVDERDPFCIAYTAGTTGDPKGVLISHRSRSLTFYASALEWGIGPGRRTIAVAPMYHGAGFAFAYAAVHCGGTVSMLRSFQPDALIDMIARDGAQSVFLVPTHAQLLRAHFGEIPRLPTLDTLYFNAAALPRVLKEWVFEAFPGVGVHELYGSTEAGVVTNLRPADARRKAGTVGHPWFGTQVRIVDPSGREVGDGEPGELYSRSPYLMNGYHENPAATAACTTEDGFLTSGDIVIRDEEGFIAIVDRVKDVIITGGVNVYPRDVEEVLLTHPAVAECAVVGEPDDRWGERVVAYLVGREPVAADALEAYLRERLAGFKVPKQYRAVAALPRNAAGKILKRELRSTP